MPAITPAPCVTLTTDFGTADGYVGAMKGVIATRAPGVPICDITHELPRHDVAAGAFALAQAAPLFPEGTVHVVVVDPGVGGDRGAVALRAGGQFFVGPDNGVTELVCPRPEAARAIEAEAFRRPEVSRTFHGRDVFAPAAAALAAGARLEDAGSKIELAGALPGAGPEGGDRVVHVDQFGNLITNVAGARVGAGAARVSIGGARPPVVGTYADVEIGDLLAYVGSAGTLEVAVREGSAAARLGVTRGARVALEKGSYAP